MTNPITTPAQMREALDRALADYIPGIDCAVRFVTIDQVDMLAEFYLHNRALPAAEQQAIRDRALDDAARAVSDRATYWWAEAAAADDTGRKKLSLSYEAKALACIELAAVIRVLKEKPE